MAKVIKGSAIQTEDDGFIFTPYKTIPPEDSPWELLNVTAYGKLRCTQECVQLHISLKKPKTVGQLQNTMLGEFSRLIANIDEKKFYNSKQTKK